MQTVARRPGRPPLEASGDTKAQDKLIQAAIRQFSLHGFGSTTLRSLAEEAGVNISLVSYYFGSKEGLYRAAISQFGHEQLAAARKVLTSQQNLEGVRAQLCEFLGELFSCYVKSPDLVRLIYSEADKCTPLIKEIFRESFFEIYNTLVSFLRGAQEQGVLKAQFDPQSAAALLLAGYSQAVRSEEISKELLGMSLLDPKYREHLKQQIVSTALFGLQSPWPSFEGES